MELPWEDTSQRSLASTLVMLNVCCNILPRWSSSLIIVCTCKDLPFFTQPSGNSWYDLPKVWRSVVGDVDGLFPDLKVMVMAGAWQKWRNSSHKIYPETNIAAELKLMVGILVSYLGGLFWGAMLVSGRVYKQISLCSVRRSRPWRRKSSNV